MWRSTTSINDGKEAEEALARHFFKIISTSKSNRDRFGNLLKNNHKVIADWKML